MYGQLAGLRRMTVSQFTRRAREGVFAIKPAVYVVFILVVAVSALLYSLRRDGIFACQGDGYTSQGYLGECSAPGYGNYEHGAFWFGLEPSAMDASKRADVLFLGDSRLQIAFSARATVDWFKSIGMRYYLLGFGYSENVAFLGKLLHRIKPQARVYIINADTFFGRSESPPAKVVMYEPDAEYRFKIKRLWQGPHRLICDAVPMLCGGRYAVFRAFETGAYNVRSELREIRNASYDYVVDRNKAKDDIASGLVFLADAPVDKQCIILTVVPYVGTKMETAKAVASSLGLQFVSPELEGLQTFDISHLDPASAQRWAGAFYAAAGPLIRRCLGVP